MKMTSQHDDWEKTVLLDRLTDADYALRHQPNIRPISSCSSPLLANAFHDEKADKGYSHSTHAETQLSAQLMTMWSNLYRFALQFHFDWMLLP
jgi:hypothetical protein